MIKYDVIVIGAGPSGMMSAGILSKRGKNVLIIEKNEKVGRKLAITGKGRCNVTNKCTTDEFIKNVTRNNKFLYSSINNFNSDDTIEFFESMGVKLKIERGNRVFPESDNAYDIVDALKKHIRRCKLIRGRASKLIINERNVNGVQLDNNRTYMASKVIIACGGKSYPGTGSNGDGYMLATQANHSITKLKGSLVPLVSSDEWIKELQGLSLKNVSIEVKDVNNNKAIYKDFGELIFTHFGLSGPIILSASTHMSFDDNNRYIVKIDLKPSLTIEQLNNRILRDFEKFYNKDFINALASRTGLTAKDSQKLATTFAESIADKLDDESQLAVQGFGVFEVKKKMERVVVNPKLKTRRLNPPKLVLAFKPSTVLKEKMQ